jgi:AcrR family transcriptional regulator
MPKLWDETIDAHRRAVRDATLDAAASLVAEQGLRAVTMSQIAERTGIGRATLYKYFPDVDAILVAWHERQVHAHMRQLVALRDRGGSARERLEAVLQAYALIQYEHSEGELAAQLHQGPHMAHAHEHLCGFISALIAEGAIAGELRDDVAAEELAAFSLGALAGAGRLPSKAAVRRLVAVSLDALRPPA